ncbi:unnamed protein product [Discosporangium mesarthrocarpum]
MKTAVVAVALVGASCTVNAFVTPMPGGRLPRVVVRGSSTSPMMAVPLELEGKLDPSKSWEVELELDGESKTLSVPEGTSVLEAAEKVFDDPPSSCRNGVCTTCAGFILTGKEGEGESFQVAVHALGQDQRDQGYTLTCQTYPCGPGLKVRLNQYDTVYEEQYGQFEKAEEGKKEPKKLFGIF